MKQSLTNYDSFWEWSKTNSSYHFDNFQTDRTDSTFVVLGNIPPTWQDELEQIRSHSFPTTWHNLSQTGGEYGRPPMAFDKRAKDIADGGGDINKIEVTDVVDDFQSFPELQKIADSFNLAKTQLRCHVQKTGQMFTRHLDPIHRMFADRPRPPGEFNYDDCGYDPLDIVRLTVMLEDWDPGQFIIYGNTVYQQWRAGDYHIFDWPNVPHATANASLSTRITLQITGLRTEQTDPRLDIRNFQL